MLTRFRGHPERREDAPGVFTESVTPEFKAEAIRLRRAGDRTVRQVAKDLDLTETALRDGAA
jgi:transposase-like protein